ncbi:unnamed protein product [Ectocarpus sp. 12 AP-2014]
MTSPPRLLCAPAELSRSLGTLTAARRRRDGQTRCGVA